jgi:hypothetical protein
MVQPAFILSINRKDTQTSIPTYPKYSIECAQNAIRSDFAAGGDPGILNKAPGDTSGSPETSLGLEWRKYHSENPGSSRGTRLQALIGSSSEQIQHPVPTMSIGKAR